MFEHILVATDLSAASETVCRNLQGLKKLGARRVLLVHALDIRHMEAMKYELAPMAEPRLLQLKGIVEEQGFEVDTQIRSHSPAWEVKLAAREQACSLIVIGTHGATLAREVLLGSVAHEVLQSAEKPVLLLPFDILAEKDEDRRQVICGDFLRHILFATDFSDVAEKAFHTLRHMADAAKPEVTLYHVQDRARIEPHLKDKLEEFNRVDMERLERLEKDLTGAGARKVHKVIEYGRPAKLLVDKANSGAYSLLVMGNQGRGYLAEAFLGRVAHHVVHHADIPVLLVPMAV
jgi:nucleotide-binding universal stress UspA family protein